MKILISRALLGACLILLFILNLTCVLLGIIYNSNWCVVTGISLSLLQLYLHYKYSGRHSLFVPTPGYVGAGRLSGKRPPRTSKGFTHGSLNTVQRNIIAQRSANINIGLVQSSLGRPFNGQYEYIVFAGQTVRIAERSLFTGLKLAGRTGTFRLNVLNIGAFNCPEADKKTVLAIAKAAKSGGCLLNTGVLGITPELLRGGCDLVWRINQDDPVCRGADGLFNESEFQRMAGRPYVRMIELPVDPRAPDFQGLFYKELCFLERLRFLSPGKPLGISLKKPSFQVLDFVCKTMLQAGIILDYILIEDSGDPGPLLSPGQEGYSAALASARRSVDYYHLPTKIIASADLVTEYDILKCLALGADACFLLKPFLFAVNHEKKSWSDNAGGQERAASNFYSSTMEATLRLMEACGYREPGDVNARDFILWSRVAGYKTLEQLYILERSIDREPVQP